jgi:hypothetical protein
MSDKVKDAWYEHRFNKWYSDNKSAKNRSRTFPGIAQAMAEQWG